MHVFNSIKEIKRLRRKEMNWLLRMSNIYFKVTIEKREKMTFPKLGLSKFKKFVSMSFYGEFQLTQMLLNFKTSCCNLKSDPHLPKKNVLFASLKVL